MCYLRICVLSCYNSYLILCNMFASLVRLRDSASILYSTRWIPSRPDYRALPVFAIPVVFMASTEDSDRWLLAPYLEVYCVLLLDLLFGTTTGIYTVYWAIDGTKLDVTVTCYCNCTRPDSL